MPPDEDDITENKVENNRYRERKSVDTPTPQPRQEREVKTPPTEKKKR